MISVDLHKVEDSTSCTDVLPSIVVYPPYVEGDLRASRRWIGTRCMLISTSPRDACVRLEGSKVAMLVSRSVGLRSA